MFLPTKQQKERKEFGKILFRELQHINVPVMLMPDDFRAFSKIKIDNHAFNKENLPSHFKVRMEPFQGMDDPFHIE